MTKTPWLAAAFLALSASCAFAQAGTAPSQTSSGSGVLVFPPSFFAGSRPDTALDMLARLPGFGLDTGDTDTRGFAGAAGNALIDGARPSSKSDSLDQILRRIPAGNVERIELIRGGAPGIDMQGRSVVANIVLKRTVQVQRVIEPNFYIYPDGYVGPVLRAQYSRTEGDNLVEGAIGATTDRTDGTSQGRRRRFDARETLIQDARLDLWDRVRNVNARGAVQRRFGGGKLRFNGLIERAGEENSLYTDSRPGLGADEFSEDDTQSWNGELGVNWTRPTGPRTELEITGLQRYSTQDYASDFESGANTSSFLLDATSGESIGRGVIRFRRSERWTLEGGGEVAYNFLDSATSYAENGVAIPLPSAAVKVAELRGEAFGQATWRQGPKLTVEAGVRVELSEISQSGDTDRSKSFVYPKPRVQATWTPKPGHQFRFRAERQVGQLDFGDFVASAEIDIGEVEAGNPDLEPYKATILEGVYERRFWDEGVFQLTVSRVEFEDVVDVIPLAGGFEGVGNIGEGTQAGLQARLTLPLKRLGLPNARLQGRLGLADSKLVDPVTGEERRFSGNAPLTCGVSFNHDLRGGRWSYGGDAGCAVVEFSQFRVREYRDFEDEPFINFYGQWKPSTTLTIRLDLGNTADRERRRTRFVYAGPRNVAPLRFREEQSTQMGQWLFVQIRKSLGPAGPKT